MTAERGRRRITLAWIGCIALACAVYGAGIAHESVCYDEMVVNAIAGHRLGEIGGLMQYDNHPPLFYILVWAVRGLLGSSEWALRLVPTAAAVGLVALGAGPVRRLLGDRIAFLYAGVVLITPAILIYAHEARMYLPATLAVTAAALYGALAVRDGRASDWGWFGFWSLAGAYLHYYALIAVFLAHAFALGWVLLGRRERLSWTLASGGVVALAYLPWVAVVVRQSRTVHDGGFWVPRVSLEAVAQALLRPFIYKEVVPGVRPWMVAGLTVWLLLIAAGAVLAWRRRASAEGAVAGLLLTVYLGTMAATIGISVAYVPVFFHRYMVVCTGVLALLVSMGAARLPGRWTPAAALGVLALLNAATLRDVSLRHFNYGMREIAAKLRGEVQPGDLIVTTESFSLGSALYYFPQAVHYFSDNTFEERWGQILNVFIPPLHHKEGLWELLASRRSFWNITCSIGIGREMADVLGDETGWEPSGEPITVLEPYSWCQYTARKYVYAGGGDAGRSDADRSTLLVHVTGLRPRANLFVILYDREPLGPSTPPARFEVVPVTGPELSVALRGLEPKDYALLLWHDENQNRQMDFDGEGRPAEGLGGSGDGASLEMFPTFDQLRFAVREPHQRVDAKVMYPPSEK